MVFQHEEIEERHKHQCDQHTYRTCQNRNRVTHDVADDFPALIENVLCEPFNIDIERQLFTLCQ